LNRDRGRDHDAPPETRNEQIETLRHQSVLRDNDARELAILCPNAPR
jgi:hypothetical protein